MNPTIGRVAYSVFHQNQCPSSNKTAVNLHLRSGGSTAILLRQLTKFLLAAALRSPDRSAAAARVSTGYRVMTRIQRRSRMGDTDNCFYQRCGGETHRDPRDFAAAIPMHKKNIFKWSQTSIIIRAILVQPWQPPAGRSLKAGFRWKTRDFFSVCGDGNGGNKFLQIASRSVIVWAVLKILSWPQTLHFCNFFHWRVGGRHPVFYCIHEGVFPVLNNNDLTGALDGLRDRPVAIHGIVEGCRVLPSTDGLRKTPWEAPRSARRMWSF